MEFGRAALLRRLLFWAARQRSPTGFGLFAHASTPLQSSAVVKPSTLANLATFLMPGLRWPRSMSLM
jgi:hypothetical protein